MSYNEHHSEVWRQDVLKEFTRRRTLMEAAEACMNVTVDDRYDRRFDQSGVHVGSYLREGFEAGVQAATAKLQSLDQQPPLAAIP